MSAAMSPSSPALRSRARVMSKCLASISAAWGRTSLVVKSTVVLAICRCSSVKSSGVKMSSGRRSSRRKLPPRKCLAAVVGVVAIGPFLLEVLENSGGAHAPSDAHRDHAVTGIAALHFLKDCGGDLRAGASEGMAERDSAAVDIDAVEVEAREPDHGERLDGEGFVELNDIDLVQREAGQFERLGDGVDRANAHLFGLATRGGEAHEARQRADAEGAGARLAHDHRGGGAVGSLRRIAGSDRSMGMEGGFEFGEGIERGIGARSFIGFEFDFGALRLRAGLRSIGGSGGDAHGNNFALELARGLRRKGIAVAAQGKGVRLFARDAVPFGKTLGSEAHREIDAGP